jgi:hypothetical protein
MAKAFTAIFMGMVGGEAGQASLGLAGLKHFSRSSCWVLGRLGA